MGILSKLKRKKKEKPVAEAPVVAGCGNCAGTGLVKNGWNVDERCSVCQGKGN